jgi:hypothetical protein
MLNVEMLGRAILKAVEARARLLIHLYGCNNDVDCIKKACMDAAYDVASAFKLSNHTAEEIAKRVVLKFLNS